LKSVPVVLEFFPVVKKAGKCRARLITGQSDVARKILPRIAADDLA
jgi:hypothetical protein